MGSVRGGVHARIAAATEPHPVRQAGPLQEATWEDRIFNRRARLAGDPRRARSHSQDRSVARALEAQEHVPGCAARTDIREDRSPSHHLQPDGDLDGPPVQHQPQPPEHPDPLGRWGARSGGASSPSPANCWSRPTTRRSSCASSLTSRASEVSKEIFARGEDVHAATAAEVFKAPPEEIGPGERSRAKAVNFGIVYGLSVARPVGAASDPHEEAAEYIKNYLSRFPAVQAFIDRTIAEANGGTREDVVRSDPPDPRARSRRSSRRGRRASARGQHHIQGTAADIMKVAMVLSRADLRETGLETRLVLTIHDELLFEAPEGRSRRRRRDRASVR